MIIDGVEITAEGLPDITKEETRQYIAYVQEEKGEKPSKIAITPAEEGYVNLDYEIHGQKFERIRRITGYLVGTLDRWNNAKRQEERDRVKHTERREQSARKDDRQRRGWNNESQNRMQEMQAGIHRKAE